MPKFIATILTSLLIVATTEYLCRRGKVKGEYARKITHITLGLYFAILPLYLSWHAIQLLGLLGLGFFILARLSHVLKSVNNVKRKSLGDIIAPVVFVLLAFIQPPSILFAAIVLHIALADGLAAVIGVRYGKGNKYKVFGYTKSVAGSATFLLTSFLIIVSLAAYGGAAHQVPFLAFILIPLLTTIIENLASHGVDNALIAAALIVLFRLFNIS